MLDAIGSTDPKTAELRSETESLLSDVKSHALFASLSAGVREKINKGDPPPYHLSQRDRCSAYGVDYDYYNAVTMQLSQYVHTLPFSVHQLFQFRAGSGDALALMSLPLQFGLAFLARATDKMRELFPDVAPVAPSRTTRTMTLWSGVARRGVKQ